MGCGHVFCQVFAAFLLFATTLALLVGTENGYGYAIDEATYRWVAQEAREWSAGLGKPSLSESISRERIDAKCHFLEPFGSRPHQPHSNFNLPASVHVLNVGWMLGGWRSDELARLRFGGELLFALTVGGVVWRISGRDGLAPAIGAGLGLLLSPRVFGHAHLAATETALVCFWLWAILAVVELSERRGTIVAAAIAAGLLAATKLTAWPACAAMVLWVVLRRRENRFALLCWMVVGPAIAVLLLTPNLWHDPIGGLRQCFSVAASSPWKIPAYFGGRTYTEGMPWWSGLAVLFATTPFAVWVFSLVSLARIRTDRLAELLWINVALLLAMRSVGLVPAHDGERQFLPALAMLGVLAGWHGGRLLQSGWMQEQPRRLRAWLGPIAAAACFVFQSAESWTYRRHGLMYYNGGVGGLAGAERLGFEVSYWFEGLTNGDWKRMLEPLPPGSKVFLRPDHPGAPDLLRWGVIPSHIEIVGAPEQAEYFLLYAKKSAYWTPVADGKTLVRTDLAMVQETAPAIREVRFMGARLASLHRRP